MSRPGPSRPTELPTLTPSGMENQRCRPLPVSTSAVGGSFPCSDSRRARESSPTSPSMSKTKSPAPVATPMFAFGHRRHQCLICSARVVPASRPLIVSGCFAGLSQSFFPQEQPFSLGQWRGKTRRPRAAYRSAARNNMEGPLIARPCPLAPLQAPQVCGRGGGSPSNRTARPRRAPPREELFRPFGSLVLALR